MKLNYNLKMVKMTIGKMNKKDLDKNLDEEPGELEMSKELQIINKDDLLASYDFISLYHIAQIDINSTWPKIETAYPFRKNMTESISSLWSGLNRCAFLTAKNHNPENLVFRYLPLKNLKTHPKTTDLRKVIEREMI